MKMTPQPRSWTRDEFYRLAADGYFRGQRAEWMAGTIMVQSPQNWPHASTTDRVFERIRVAFGSSHWTRMQLPLHLPDAEPEPDISVVPGQRGDYSAHPTTAVLVVEVADTSLSFDMGEKATMYAAAGISDYWVVAIAHQQVMVHRQPSVNGYGAITVHSRGESIAPLAMPSTMIAVSDLI